MRSDGGRGHSVAAAADGYDSVMNTAASATRARLRNPTRQRSAFQGGRRPDQPRLIGPLNLTPQG